MRLRQKIFIAIVAVMVVMFLLLALASFLQGLEAERAQGELVGRIERAIAQDFQHAARSPDDDRWRRFAEKVSRLSLASEWEVLERGRPVLAGGVDTEGMVETAREGDCVLLRSREVVGLPSVAWLPGLFWAVAAGTAFLLLVVYGLLLRLVFRPVEDLVSASRALSKGVRPGKVPGESRTDEIGELVRTFNEMTEEVCQSREELRARVEEATAEYEKAQKRLVLESRLAATGKLAAGIAHEVANPLGGMINAARTISKEKGLSERGAEYVGLIEDGLARIARIVERMRTFVKPKPSVGTVNLVETVTSAVAFVRHRVEAEGVELRQEYPDRAVEVTGDAQELQQAFLNLIVNALDAMAAPEDAASRRRELTLSVEPPGPGEAEAVVTVADSGPGMGEEELANAFDLFYSTKGEGGSGLGLAITHKIVTDHGGAIDLESPAGGGTVARVRLPLSAEATDGSAPE